MRALAHVILATIVSLQLAACRAPAETPPQRPGANAPVEVEQDAGPAPVTPAGGSGAVAPSSPASRPPTGFEDTVWGASRKELAAEYPGFPLVSAYIFGLEATAELVLHDGGLHLIRVRFARYFHGMESCGVEFERLRAELGKELGRSQTDNLSALWRTEASEVALQCDLDDDEGVGATMSLVYQPREP